MKRVVITLPHFIEDEATYINQLFESVLTCSISGNPSHPKMIAKSC